MAITQPMAQAFHIHPGDHMTWQFSRGKLGANGLPTGAVVLAQRTTFLVTGDRGYAAALGRPV